MVEDGVQLLGGEKNPYQAWHRNVGMPSWLFKVGSQADFLRIVWGCKIMIFSRWVHKTDFCISYWWIKKWVVNFLTCWSWKHKLGESEIWLCHPTPSNMSFPSPYLFRPKHTTWVPSRPKSAFSLSLSLSQVISFALLQIFSTLNWQILQVRKVQPRFLGIGFRGFVTSDWRPASSFHSSVARVKECSGLQSRNPNSFHKKP